MEVLVGNRELWDAPNSHVTALHPSLDPSRRQAAWSTASPVGGRIRKAVCALPRSELLQPARSLGAAGQVLYRMYMYAVHRTDIVQTYIEQVHRTGSEKSPLFSMGHDASESSAKSRMDWRRGNMPSGGTAVGGQRKSWYFHHLVQFASRRFLRTPPLRSPTSRASKDSWQCRRACSGPSPSPNQSPPA